MKSDQESGVVLIAIVIILLPVVVTVGAFTSAMTSRTERLSDEVQQELALMAAESGVDFTIYLGQLGGYLNGSDLTYTYSLGTDTQCTVNCTYLQSDGVDNDGDGVTDGADPDEDCYQVISAGTNGRTTRRVAAYLGAVPAPPMSFPGAVSIMNPSVVLDLNGTPNYIGFDTNIDGSRGDPTSDVPGLSIVSPGTMSDLLAELSPSEQSYILGAGGTPSLGTSASLDLTSLITMVQNSADTVLTNSRYASYSFGDASAGTQTIAYRDGDVKFSGNVRGSGILVVTGDIELTGDFRYDGIIICLGDVVQNGTAQVFGAFVHGPAGGSILTRGTFDVRYSSEALSMVNTVGGLYVSFNGWQELAR